MHAQFVTLAQASVLQLRDAIRRATATQLPADGRNGEAFLAGVEVRDSSWGEWLDTAYEVKRGDA
jgi:hypothetical protein